jgi:hypothetical protein
MTPWYPASGIRRRSSIVDDEAVSLNLDHDDDVVIGFGRFCFGLQRRFDIHRRTVHQYAHGCSALQGTPEAPPPATDHPQEIQRNQTASLQKIHWPGTMVSSIMMMT